MSVLEALTTSTAAFKSTLQPKGHLRTALIQPEAGKDIVSHGQEETAINVKKLPTIPRKTKNEKKTPLSKRISVQSILTLSRLHQNDRPLRRHRRRNKLLRKQDGIEEGEKAKKENQEGDEDSGQNTSEIPRTTMLHDSISESKPNGPESEYRHPIKRFTKMKSTDNILMNTPNLNEKNSPLSNSQELLKFPPKSKMKKAGSFYGSILSLDESVADSEVTQDSETLTGHKRTVNRTSRRYRNLMGVSSDENTNPAVQHTFYRNRFSIEGQARIFFRKSARKVWIVCQWTTILSRRTQHLEDQLKSFLDIASEIEASTTETGHIQEASGLCFDLSDFRAEKEIRLNPDIKYILTLPSDYRTEEMIQRVLLSLQKVGSFAEYPPHMQTRFAKVAWYQEIPAKKVIIKQGQKAENFYFILKGTAIVKKMVGEGENVAMQAVARMQRGQSFGEVALVHNSLRSASVESATRMDVLVVDREDFNDIFVEERDGNEPDHIRFCREDVAFLKGFPAKGLSLPENCVFHYFKPGAVVSSDGRKSEWIYIVKTGQCRVLKRLKEVLPKRHSLCLSIEESPALPRDGTSIPGPRIDSGLRHSCPSLSHSGGGHNQRLIQVLSRNNTQILPHTEETVLSPAIIVAGDEDDDQIETGRWTNGHSRVQSIPNILESAHLVTERRRSTFFSPESDSGQTNNKQVRFSNKPDTSDRRTSKWDLGSKHVIHGADGTPCYVQLRKLRPTEAFGLEYVIFEDEKNVDPCDTSVTLVSSGAELIMLSRRFFIQNASLAVKQYIRQTVRPFPPEDTLQDNLQTEVNWVHFRREVVRDFVDQRLETKDLLPMLQQR